MSKIETPEEFDFKAFGNALYELYKKYIDNRKEVSLYLTSNTSREEGERLNGEANRIYEQMVDKVAITLRQLPFSQRDTIVKIVSTVLIARDDYNMSEWGLLGSVAEMTFWQEVAKKTAGN